MPDLYARVSQEEHAAALRFAEEHGVTVTGLATALCRWLESQEEASPEVDRCIKMVVAEAERVDAERRERRRQE